MKIIFVVVLVLVLAWFAARLLKARYTVKRSLRVRATPQAVFDLLRDFRRWKDWSPWLIHDTACVLEFDRPQEIGGFYTWNSAKIGEGRVTHTAMQPGESLAMDLTFIRPFRSEAKVQFSLLDAGVGYTDVCWTMSSALPFFMRPWLGTFTRMIGLDFELGLLHLSALLDPQAEVPRIIFDGPVTREALTLVTESYSGPLADLGPVLDKGYARLRQRVGAAQVGPPLALYDNINQKKRTTVCDMALPVAPDSAIQPQRKLPSGRYYRVTLTGHHRFIELAWHNALGHARMEKFKPQMQRPCIEVYPTDPATQPDSNRWVTELYVPIP